MPVLDHLVLGAATLAEGVDRVEAALGVRPQPGGQHAGMGTHNALLGLGPDAYLEVIAIDPDAAAPGRPRWFGLDDPAVRARLARGPALLTWVARAGDLDAALADAGPGLDVLAMARGDLRWRFALAADECSAEGGLVPSLIEWAAGTAHPAARLDESGCRLVALAGTHPQPRRVEDALAALGLAGTVEVEAGPADRPPTLSARLRTPDGERVLSGV